MLQVLGPTVITYQKIIPGSTEVSFVLPWLCMQERLPTPISLFPPRSRDRASAENVATLSCPIVFYQYRFANSGPCRCQNHRPVSCHMIGLQAATTITTTTLFVLIPKFKCTKVRRTIAWLPEITLLLKIENWNNKQQQNLLKIENI